MKLRFILRMGIVLAATAFVPATGCEKTTSHEPLTVYSGRGEKLVGPVIAAYESKTGRTVKVRYASTAQLAATLLEEGTHSPADVFLAQDASTLGLLESKKMFAPLDAALVARVPTAFRSADGRWVGVTGRARVLAYNNARVKPDDLPASAAHLVKPEWKGRVGWAPENASFQSFVAAMGQLEGWDATERWLVALRDNQPRVFPSNTPMVQALGRGEIDVGLTNHYYLYRLRAEEGDDFPVANHFFKDGSAAALVNLSGAAVLASSRHRSDGAELIAFLLSPEGQSMFVDGNHEIPLVAGVAAPADLPAADELKAPQIDLAALSDLEATVELLRKTRVLP